MQLRSLLLITAVLGIVFGAGFILVPSLIWSLYGMTLDPGGVYQARMFGATSVGLALTLLFTRSFWALPLERAFAQAIMVWTLIGGLVILTAQLQSVMNVMGWAYVGLNLVFVVAYGYFLFIKRPVVQPMI